MNSEKSDEFIKREVVDQLTWDNSLNSNDVFVSVSDGVVQLTGVVPTYIAKMAAEKNAFRVAGVTQVENLIEVESPTGITLPDDTEITNMIESKLIWNDQIDATKITVETHNGIVTLSGNVNSYWEKNLAADIAFATRGVLQVNNDLAVIVEKTFTDLDIANDIKRAFKRNVLINPDKIDVSVTNGVAHLTGIVPFYSMKEEAFVTAMLTAGVRDVIDDIAIG
ncbi:MAG: BON domain-containing protein [Bacteroidales bacterium]